MSSFISSGSSSSSWPSVGSQILTIFSENLNIPMEAPGDASKVLGIMKKVLTDTPHTDLQSQLTGTLGERVTILQSLLEPSFLQSHVGTAAAGALRGEMRGLMEKKIVELKSLVSKETRVEFIQKIQKALPEIPPHRMASFISTVEGFYGKALSEGKAPREALSLALGKGMVKSLISLPSADEMDANEELQEKIEADPEFKPYSCIINGDLVISDGVYLREDASHTPIERYHDKVIRDWITAHHTDPVERSPRTVADIKPDHKGREFVESKLFAILYPEFSIDPSVSSEVEPLCSKAFLLALGAAYPLIKEEYAGALSQSQDSHILVGAVEASARETLDRFTSLVEGMNFEEEVATACFPAIEGFLRQAESNLTGENLGEVREEFLKKLRTFVAYFHEIKPVSISAASKEKALKLGGEAIGKGASLEAVMELFVKFVGSIMEEDEIRAAFPGCLLGDREWTTHLGAVEKVPLPAQILSILSGPCPITPGLKVGDTHILVLIPETVGGQPLTLNSLGALVKSKGHFPGTEAGYDYMCGSIATEHGNKPAGGSHYVLMTKDVLSGSRNKSYEDQQAMVTALAGRSGVAYEVPSVLPVTAGVLVNYLASGVFLFGREPWTFTRCQERDGACPVDVGGFAAAGLKVFNDVCDFVNFGVAALRKF